jgi:hypothetical protein
MQKIVPSEVADNVGSLAKRRGVSGIGQRNYPDTAAHVSSTVKVDGVRSKPISSNQAREAAANTEHIASKITLKEAGATVASAALISGGLRGGVAAAKNIKRWHKKEIPLKDAAKATAQEATVATLDGVAKGGATVVFQKALIRVGAKKLAASGGAAAIAFATVEAVKDAADCYRGKISGAELKEKMVLNASGTGLGFGGAVGGAAFGTMLCPGIGTIIGGLAGSCVGNGVGNLVGKKAIKLFRKFF